MYDNQLGRFFNVDPWAEKYYSQSSYLYAYNNPTRYTDMLGLGADDEVKKNKVDYDFGRTGETSDKHTLVHTENNTYENVSKDGSTKTVDNVTITTTSVITKERIVSSKGDISDKTSVKTMQKVDVTTQTYSKGEDGDWVSNNDSRTTNIASNTLGEGELGSVKLPSGWKMNASIDSRFGGIVNDTKNFVVNADYGDNLVDNNSARSAIAYSGTVSTIVGGVAQVVKVGHWLRRAGQASTTVGCAVLALEGTLYLTESTQESMELARW
jgi:hypothetical protein